MATLVRELVVQAPRRLFRECVYCGFPCVGIACRQHRDLLALDPHYSIAVTTSRRLA